MFEWLIGREKSFEGGYGEITGFNMDTKKLMFKGVEEIDGKEIEKTMDFNLFESYLQQNIDWYDNWDTKIFNALQDKGMVRIHIFSTQEKSGDSWFVDIYKLKTELPKNIEKVAIVNYVIEFCGEIKGEMLSLQDGVEDEQELFNKWINNQIEIVSEFNHDGYWQTFSSMIMSDVFSSKEELHFAYDLFGEQKLGLEYFKET